jgi:probable HAF family extracellular repeat protein
MAATYTTAKIGLQTITGAGDDIIDGDRNKKADINAGNGKNLIRTGRRSDVIEAGDGNDFIDAGDGNNFINAGKGDNRILTGDDRDTITVGAGNSYVSSGAGNDTITALLGNSTINAGTGEDVIKLGGGNNKIILETSTGKSLTTISGFDITKDKLRLGESLMGQTLTFKTEGNDTIVLANGKDLVARLEGVASGSAALIDTEPLTKYEVTELKSFTASTVNPNLNVNAAAINDFGQIIGRLDTTGTFSNQNATTDVINGANVIRQGFLWDKGALTALTSLGTKKGSSDFGTANGAAADGAKVNMLTPNPDSISNRGIILGTGDEVRIPIGQPTDRALLWKPVAVAGKPDRYNDLQVNDFGGQESYFFDINNSNQIAGRNILESGFDIPILVENGKVTKLDNLGGDGGTARGINNQGQIVGLVDKDGLANEIAVNTAALWNKDSKGVYKLTDLGTFGAAQASLRDINDSGQIIGQTSNGLTGSDLATNAFILRDKNNNGKYEANEKTDLGSLGGKTGTANAINSFGVVVGTSQTTVLGGADGKTLENHAFIWSEGKITDLNSLVTKPILYEGAKVVLTSAVGINNFGDIAAIGTYIYKNTVTGKDAIATRSFELKGIANKVVTGITTNPMAVTASATVAKTITEIPVVASGNSVVKATDSNIVPLVATTGIGGTTPLNVLEPVNPLVAATTTAPKIG